MELNTQVEPRTREDMGVGEKDSPLLAAAIAALLVEYQRYTGQRDGDWGSQSDQTNWRTLGRWQQLRG